MIALLYLPAHFWRYTVSIKNFSPQGDAETPFNKQRDSGAMPFAYQLDHFNLFCGHVIKENRILRTVAVVLVLANFLSIGITLYAVSLPDSIPVLVTMNDFGETQYVGAVSRRNFQNYAVPELAVQYQVKEFVNLCYTLSTDRAVMKKSLNKTYHLLTSTTASKYSSRLKEEKPFDDFGSKTREVLFQTEPLQLSKDSYQIDFQVITRSLSGSVLADARYRAVVSVQVLQPSEEDIKDNPLGIYITAFDFKEIYAS